MAQIMLERSFDPPLTTADFLVMAQQAGDCLSLYRTTWHESLLAMDGKSLVCSFDAPDTESVRMLASRTSAIRRSTWPGTVHDMGRNLVPNVLVERQFDEPVTLEQIQAIEDKGAWCLDLHQVKFLRTYFSADQMRMICLYHAPDAESVRLAQHQARMPVQRIWGCQYYSPEKLGPSKR